MALPFCLSVCLFVRLSQNTAERERRGRTRGQESMTLVDLVDLRDSAKRSSCENGARAERRDLPVTFSSISSSSNQSLSLMPTICMILRRCARMPADGSGV